MFKPYVEARAKVKEFSLKAIVLGLLLGLVFAVGNAYLALKVGTTVSASIPAAVLSMAILRTFFKRVTILENNLVQTIASVGEGLAAGVVFTVPALYILGDSISAMKIFVLSSLGGVLGVLLMIPMRRYIIVKEHGKLPFPEGTACAEILKSGEAKSGPKAAMALIGIGVGAVYKFVCSGLHLFRETFSWVLPWYEKTKISIDATPALLGVGFIIGPRIASVVFAGGAFGWWVFIPLIKMFGLSIDAIYPGTVSVTQMSADDIWSNYVRYIGAGAVATGGLMSLFRIVPIIWKTIHHGVKELFQNQAGSMVRTDRDISLKWLILGSVGILFVLWLVPDFKMNFLTIVLLMVLGFFFVAVTSLTVGIVGSTSNPVSGMTITTLLITCLVFVGLGWTERFYLLAALTMAIVVNVAICLAGTTSQDLKTGYIVGATPRAQQLAEILGVFLPALAIGGTVFLLNKAFGFGSKELPAPQGTMMALIAKGVIQGNIPFILVSVGVVIGLILELVRVPILPFAVGLYLPLSLSTPIMLGGVVSQVVRKISQKKETNERGVLTASGLVAGDACMGVVLALLAVLGITRPGQTPILSDWIGLSIFILLAIGLGWFTLRKRN